MLPALLRLSRHAAAAVRDRCVLLCARQLRSIWQAGTVMHTRRWHAGRGCLRWQAKPDLAGGQGWAGAMGGEGSAGVAALECGETHRCCAWHGPGAAGFRACWAECWGGSNRGWCCGCKGLGWQWGRCSVLVCCIRMFRHRDKGRNYVQLGFGIWEGAALAGSVTFYSVDCVHCGWRQRNVDWAASCAVIQGMHWLLCTATCCDWTTTIRVSSSAVGHD
jgi:hypothetical protein